MLVNKTTIVFSCSAFLVGCLLGYLSTQATYFSIEKDVNLVDISGIVVNIILAYFISRVLEKRKTEDRVEKDMLIDKLKKIDLISDKISSMTTQIAFNDATAIFKELGMELGVLRKMFDYIEIRLDEAKFEDLKSNIFEFKKLVTNQNVSNNQISFGSITAQKIMVMQRNIKNITFKLIVDCNRV